MANTSSRARSSPAFFELAWWVLIYSETSSLTGYECRMSEHLFSAVYRIFDAG